MGAADYITKPFPNSVLRYKVKTIFNMLEISVNEPAHNIYNDGKLMIDFSSLQATLNGNKVIILADEPTGNLDSKASENVLSLLKATSMKFHQTVVMITHNCLIAMTVIIVTIQKSCLYTNCLEYGIPFYALHRSKIMSMSSQNNRGDKR